MAGVLIPVAVIAGWANATLYDSEEFSNRAVALLESPVVRREMAVKLTEQLARGGNQQAINFRPAFELAVDAAIDTDTFRSIFRTAVRRLHEAVLSGQGGEAGLNLSESIAIITTTLQLPGSAQAGEQTSGGLGDSLADVTGQLDSYRFWDWQDITAAVLLFGIFRGRGVRRRRHLPGRRPAAHGAPTRMDGSDRRGRPCPPRRTRAVVGGPVRRRRRPLGGRVERGRHGHGRPLHDRVLARRVRRHRGGGVVAHDAAVHAAGGRHGHRQLDRAHAPDPIGGASSSDSWD